MTPSPIVENQADATPASSTAKIPVAWASLDLTGRLIYLSSLQQNAMTTASIKRLDLDTGETTTIFDAPAHAWIYYMTVSPDAKQLIMTYSPPYEDNSPVTRSLYIMPLDGSEPPRLLIPTASPDDQYYQAEWSPDGKYIYFSYVNHQTSTSATQTDYVYVLSRMAYPDGPIEKIREDALWPRLSSDLSRLVYVSQPFATENKLFISDPDTGEAQEVVVTSASDLSIKDAPLFLPDGKTILFSVPTPTQSYQPNWFEKLTGIEVAKAHNIPSDWWSVPITGGAPTQLTHIQTTGLFGSLSPDNKHLASLSAQGIFVMDLDGSNLTELISDPGVHGTVTWIPK